MNEHGAEYTPDLDLQDYDGGLDRQTYTISDAISLARDHIRALGLLAFPVIGGAA